MGQRSQIYLRYSGKLIFANYYQWNYGERMISRARWGIEWVKEFVGEKYDFVFRDKRSIEQMRRVFDVNFDMKDVALSCDIVKEWSEQFSDEPFNDVVFNGQDNNDGQLFIDIPDIRDGKIYYCFRDMHEDTIMDAAQYMKWDSEDWEKSKFIAYSQKSACRANIKAISEMASLMTREQLDDFLNGDYEEQRKYLEEDKT